MSPSAQRHRRAFLWSAALCASLVAGGLIVILLTAADYGAAWDDYVHTTYGNLVLDYFQSGGRDRTCNEFLDLRFYGPGLDLAAAVVAQFAPTRTVEIRHVLSAATALLAVPALWGFGRLLGRPWVAVIAAVMLCAMPVFYGYAFINTKDIPFAVAFLWSMYYFAAIFTKGAFSWLETLACGVAVGLTVAVRPGGWMLLLPLYAAVAAWCDWRRWGRQRNADKQGLAPRRRSLLKQGCLILIAWLVMISAWPWAHENPWLHPLQAIRMASRFHIVVPVFFEGQLIPSNELPRYYLLKHLLISTPPLILGLALVGLAALAVRCLARPDHPRTVAYLVLAAWLGMPLCLFLALRPNAYDGLRHFLFLLPAVALLAAIGCDWLWRKLPAGAARTAMATVFAAAALWQVQTLVRLHPYQMTYFNCLAGGSAGAAQRYDIEPWMTSYREAIEWIERQPHSGQPVHVLVAANENSRWCAQYFASDRLQITATRSYGQPGDLPAGIDYYVGTSRSGMNGNFPLAIVAHEIGRDGAVFTTIKVAARASRSTTGTAPAVQASSRRLP